MAIHESTTDRETDLTALEAEGQALLDQEDYDGLRQWLNALPAEQVARRARLLYLRARSLAQADHLDAAIPDLERARQQAVQAGDWSLAIDCCLWLSRLHQRQESISVAKGYLEAAEALTRQHPPADTVVEARFALAVGRLYPDLGDNRQAVAWCTRALSLFEGAGDVSGQVEALWLLAVAHCYLVNLHEAMAYIDRALGLSRAHGLDEVQRLYLLNVRAHIALYAGQTDVGLAVLDEAAPLLTRHPVSKPALYLAMAEGALRRQAGDLDGSLAAYARAEGILEELGDVGFRPWLTMEQGWTRLLAGEEPAEVRRVLLTLSDPQNAATRRSVEVHLGVLDALERRWEDALARLTAALSHFQATGEGLSVFAVQTYLAYVHLQRGDRLACHAALREGLGWAESVSVDGFPHLWHPTVVAEACAEALRAGVHPRQAEMMLIRRLGDAGVPALIPLLDDPSPVVRRRARSVAAAIGGDAVLRLLDEIADVKVREAMLEHLGAGRLALSRLLEIARYLSRGEKDVSQPDWVRVAVFGYYAGTALSRAAIAGQLARSQSAVKKHISAIRAAFGVKGRRGRDAGRAEVRRRAVAQGWVLHR